MSVQLAHPPLPGETPFAWSARVLQQFYGVAPPPPRPAAAPGTSDGEIPCTAAVARRQPTDLHVVAAETPPRCTYCGSRTPRRGIPVACPAHRDLIEVDPLFTPQNTEPVEDFRPEVLLDRLVTTGA